MFPSQLWALGLPWGLCPVGHGSLLERVAPFRRPCTWQRSLSNLGSYSWVIGKDVWVWVGCRTPTVSVPVCGSEAGAQKTRGAAVESMYHFIFLPWSMTLPVITEHISPHLTLDSEFSISKVRDKMWNNHHTVITWQNISYVWPV